MTMEVDPQFLVRGTTLPHYYPDTDARPGVSPSGATLVIPTLPPLVEMARLGRTWQVFAAAVDNLTAIPTTTAPHSLWNGEAQGSGICYVVEEFGSANVVVDATQTNCHLIVAAMQDGTFTAPTDAGLTKMSTSGRTAGSGTAARTVAGATVVDRWVPHNADTQMAAAAAGTKFRVNSVKPNGMYIIRPGGLFSWGNVSLAAVTSSTRYFIRWHEVKLDFVS